MSSLPSINSNNFTHLFQQIDNTQQPSSLPQQQYQPQKTNKRSENETGGRFPDKLFQYVFKFTLDSFL